MFSSVISYAYSIPTSISSMISNDMFHSSGIQMHIRTGIHKCWLATWFLVSKNILSFRHYQLCPSHFGCFRMDIHCRVFELHWFYQDHSCCCKDKNETFCIRSVFEYNWPLFILTNSFHNPKEFYRKFQQLVAFPYNSSIFFSMYLRFLHHFLY